MTTRDEARIDVTYHFPDGDERQIEWEYIPPAIGNGWVDEDNTRYRIADVWSIHAKRGRFEYGVHVFLEEVEESDDRLHRVAPDYYRRDINVEEFGEIPVVGEVGQA